MQGYCPVRYRTLNPVLGRIGKNRLVIFDQKEVQADAGVGRDRVQAMAAKLMLRKMGLQRCFNGMEIP
jgi:hypothetical protein